MAITRRKAVPGKPPIKMMKSRQVTWMPHLSKSSRPARRSTRLSTQAPKLDLIRSTMREGQSVASSSHFRLLALPAEMRNIIYEFALPATSGPSFHDALCAVPPPPPPASKPTVASMSAISSNMDPADFFPWSSQARARIPYPSHAAECEPALLRVCSSIRDEARAIYYKNNSFHVHARDMDLSLAVKWIKWVGAKNARHIPFISVVCWPLDWSLADDTIPFLLALHEVEFPASHLHAHAHNKGMLHNGYSDFWGLLQAAKDNEWDVMELEEAAEAWLDLVVPADYQRGDRLRCVEWPEASISVARKAGKHGLRALKPIKYAVDKLSEEVPYEDTYGAKKRKIVEVEEEEEDDEE